MATSNPKGPGPQGPGHKPRFLITDYSHGDEQPYGARWRWNSKPVGACGCLWLYVAACGSMLLPVAACAECGRLWLAVAACGWLWLPMAACSCLWLPVAACGCLSLPVGGCRCLWLLVAASGRRRALVAACDKLAVQLTGLVALPTLPTSQQDPSFEADECQFRIPAEPVSNST